MKLLVQNLFVVPGHDKIIAEIASISCRLAFHALSDVKRERSEALFVKNILSDNFEGEAWVATEGGLVKGLLCIQALPWDSKILGTPAFKITQLETFNATAQESGKILDALLGVALDTLRTLSRSHCHVRIPSDDVEAANSLGRVGFEKVESLNTYGARLNEIGSILASYKATPLEMRFIEADDIDWARQLSREAVNPYDRFHADKLISGCADDFMEAWINGCTSGFCDTNFIGLAEGQRAGFALWQSGRRELNDIGAQIARLALGAVSKSFSGRGIHRTLVARGCLHFAAQGADWVVMSTQEENMAAIHSMTTLGWRLLHQEATWSAGFGG
jgi:ribosomal protein S18 acetylase RimI-like enzyme